MTRLRTKITRRTIVPIAASHGVTDRFGPVSRKELERFEALPKLDKAAEHLAVAIARRVRSLAKRDRLGEATLDRDSVELSRGPRTPEGLRTAPLCRRNLMTCRSGRHANIPAKLRTVLVDSWCAEFLRAGAPKTFRVEVKLDIDEAAALATAVEATGKAASQIPPEHYRKARAVHVRIVAPAPASATHAKHLRRGQRFMSKHFAFCETPYGVAA